MDVYFKFLPFGESHGAAISVVIDGCPAGLKLQESDIQAFLNRRKPRTKQIHNYETGNRPG